jgi:small subunit ribosomal protein S16
MLRIRFKRVGRKHQPAFRIIVVERRSKRDGEAIDDIGFYNPITKDFGINKERLEYWLKNGAEASATVFNLLVNRKILSGPKIKIKIKSKNKSKSEIKENKPTENSSVKETKNEIETIKSSNESSNENA